MERLGHFIANLVLIFSLGLAILLLIPLLPLAKEWYQLVVVKSASMEPWLPVGSLAVYRSQPDYVPGEVIAYQAKINDGLETIVHRVVEKQAQDQQTIFLTQGDATQYLDLQPVFKSQVKGRVIFIIPHLGYVFGWLRSSIGIAVMVFTPLLFLIISELQQK